ncbi:MAG: roadblock/LC7 domain-containing protein [Candidatus Helarchaeales archaeon]
MLHAEKIQLDELQEFLDQVTQKVGFLGTFICSDEGLIILSSLKNRDFNLYGAINIEAIAAMIASFLFKNEIMDISFISDLCITFNRINIHVHVINGFKTTRNKFFIISLIPIEMRYYKRIIKKLDLKVTEYLSR